jgi:hypothetical protein
VARGDLLDLRALGDVADRVFGVELLRERPQPLLAAREQDAAPAAPGETARDRLAEAARRACDDGYARVDQSAVA